MNHARTVLLVEHEPVLRRCLAMHLESQGIHVWAAGSLHEARLLLEGLSFDAAILDAALPDGDGLSLLEETSPELSIVITAHRDPDRLDRYGVRRHLTKPFDLDAASRLVTQLFEAHPDR